MIELPKDMEFKSRPFAHQLDGLMQSRDKKSYALLCEMGTGKSALLLYNVAYLFSQGKINGLVIICPKSISRSWLEQQIPAHLPDSIARRVVIWGPQSKALDSAIKGLFQIEPLTLHVLIMNTDAIITERGYDTLEKFLRSHDALLAIDESTSIKNHRAGRTKVITKLGRLARYRRILTGTPVANRPMDVYSQFEFLEAGCLGIGSWFAFRNRYAVTVSRYVNGRRFEEIIGWQRLDELQQNIAKLSFRVLKKDCLDLPEKIYQKRYIELSPEQKKYYEELKKEALTELASGTTVAAPLVITRVLRLRQALCNLAPKGEGEVEFISDKDPRLNEVLDLVEEAGDQKILIWSCFTPSIIKLVTEINKAQGAGTAKAFYGEVNLAERQAIIDEFQDPLSRLRVMVLQPRTGGEGITLTKATLVIYHDNDWGLKVRLQSEDRAHRIGQTEHVTYVDLIAKDTVDETIVDALTDKKNLAEVVTGDALRNLLVSS